MNGTNSRRSHHSYHIESEVSVEGVRRISPAPSYRIILRVDHSLVEDAVLSKVMLGELELICVLDEVAVDGELAHLVSTHTLDVSLRGGFDLNVLECHRVPLSPEKVLAFPAHLIKINRSWQQLRLLPQLPTLAKLDSCDERGWGWRSQLVEPEFSTLHSGRKPPVPCDFAIIGGVEVSLVEDLVRSQVLFGELQLAGVVDEVTGEGEVAHLVSACAFDSSSGGGLDQAVVERHLVPAAKLLVCACPAHLQISYKRYIKKEKSIENYCKQRIQHNPTLRIQNITFQNGSGPMSTIIVLNKQAIIQII